jgi:uncharacterized protein (TIGR02996 family)
VELDEAILKNPDDVDAYLVLADWLQQRGDPHGELVALQVARQRNPHDEDLWARERALIEEQSPALLGSLFGREDVRYRLRYGFLERVEIGTGEETDGDPIELFRRLVELPAARFLRELHVALHDALDSSAIGELLETMAGALPPTLRVLALDGDDYRTELGDVTVLYGDLARLEELRVQAHGAHLGTIALPALRSAEILLFVTAENLESLRTAEWPRLEHLCIDCEHFADDLVLELPRWKLLRQLRSLELGCLRDDGARRLIETSAAYQHLERFVIHHHRISNEELASELGRACNASVDVSSEYPTNSQAGEVNRLRDARDFAGALAILEPMIERFPRIARYWCIRGELTDDNTEALAYYDRAIELDPTFVTAHVNRGSTLSDMGDSDGAIASYDRALAIDDKSCFALNNRAFQYYQRGHYVRAELDVRAAIATTGPRAERGHALAYCTLAEICAATDRLDEGLTALERGVALDNSFEEFARTSDTVAKLRALPRFDAAITAALH